MAPGRQAGPQNNFIPPSQTGSLTQVTHLLSMEENMGQGNGINCVLMLITLQVGGMVGSTKLCTQAAASPHLASCVPPLEVANCSPATVTYRVTVCYPTTPTTLLSKWWGRSLPICQTCIWANHGKVHRPCTGAAWYCLLSSIGWAQESLPTSQMDTCHLEMKYPYMHNSMGPTS